MTSICLLCHGRLPQPLRKKRLCQASKLCAKAAQDWSRPDTPWQELTIHLIHDAISAQVNADILGHEGPTDVITQAYAPIPGEPPGLIGELYVNIDEAARMVQRLGKTTLEAELILYIAHGCDHLTGADDATPSDRAQMRRRDLRWRRFALAHMHDTANTVC